MGSFGERGPQKTEQAGGGVKQTLCHLSGALWEGHFLGGLWVDQLHYAECLHAVLYQKDGQREGYARGGG